MFADLLKAILSPTPKQLDGDEAQLALGALLVRIAKSDQSYEAIEIDQIDTVLSAQFNLDLDEAKALREKAEYLESEAPDTVRFTRALKDTIPLNERIQIIEGLWQVALADGERDHEEDSLVRLVANLLGITDVESAKARQRIAK